MRILGKTKNDKDFREISFSLILSITGGTITGLFLINLIDSIGLLVGLFILLPGILEMHGNIYGSLSARLSNLLILGKLNKKKERNYFITQNVIAVLFLTLVVSFALGLLSYLFVNLVFHVNNINLILIAVLSSLLGTVFEIPFTIFTTIWFFKHNFDPEDIMGPYITTLGDIISIVSIGLVAGVLL